MIATMVQGCTVVVTTAQRLGELVVTWKFIPKTQKWVFSVENMCKDI